MATLRLSFVALLVGSLMVSAQQIPAPEVFNDVIDVRVVNVEAVVTDQRGEPVRGLSAADFRLLVDGKEVPIDYFTEVAEGRAAHTAPVEGVAAPREPDEAVGRSYLVFIDESFAVAGHRDFVLEKIESSLSLLGAEDRMAVLVFDGRQIHVLCPWTADRSALARALAEARRRKTRGSQLIAQHRSMTADVETTVWAATLMEYSADEVASLLEPMGKRVSPEARTQLGRTAPAMAAALRGFEAPPGRKVMLLLSGGWSMGVAPQLFGPLIEAANRLGYTLYPVDVANPTPLTLKALDGLAAATGGKVANAVGQDVFRRVVEDSGSYYWLGFIPAWAGVDRTHSIEVELKRPGLKVRARHGFSDLSQAKETALKAEGVLLFGGNAAGQRLIVQLGDPRPAGRGTIELPVTLGVPVESLALTALEKGYVAEAPLAIAIVDDKGGRSDVSGPRLRVAVREVPRGGYARFQTVVKLRRASQRLVFTVRDAVHGGVLWGEASFKP
ncbi:MAG TPA: VWA domain-containing protein [Thermoanaerobaculia bacterium]